MSRTDRLLKHINRAGKGIEVAPFFNPAVPKRDGYDVLIFDVFDTQTLHGIAKDDPFIPDERIGEIEDVDFVGDASRIGEVLAENDLLGRISYIVSSHNFEHIPNPIRFLQGCYDALEVGGVLSMAVPDFRACYDHYRIPTRLSDWLSAYHEDRTQPTAETFFDAKVNLAMYSRFGTTQHGCFMFPFDDPANFKPVRNLKSLYEDYVAHKAEPGDYRDAHVSVIFPELIELMLSDLHHLSLVKFEIIEITQTLGLEFYIHLRKPAEIRAETDDMFYQKREILLSRVAKNLTYPTPISFLRRPVHYLSGKSTVLGHWLWKKIR